MHIAVSTEMVLLAGAFSLLVGFVLLKMGLHARRRGVMPHCRGCDYNLTGLRSGRCPECGVEIAEETTVFGERTRKPVIVVFGFLCIAAGLICTIGAGRQIDWYQYAPTFVVMRDLDAGNQAIARKAWTEIKRREKSLSESQRDKLIDKGLKQQASALPCPAQQEFIQFVARCSLLDLLSESQKTTFFEQMVSLKLAIPLRVVQGDELVYKFNYDLRGPSRYSDEYMQIKIRHGAISVDGKALYEDTGYSTMFNVADQNGTSVGRDIKQIELGPHEFLMSPTITIMRREQGVGQSVVYQRSLEWKCVFEVVGL